MASSHLPDNWDSPRPPIEYNVGSVIKVPSKAGPVKTDLQRIADALEGILVQLRYPRK